MLPSTRMSTRDPSLVPSGQRGVRDLSPVLDHDPQGSSRTTGGAIRGRALGGGYRFADAGKLMPMLIPTYHNIFCSLEPMDVDMDFFSSKISGKVLLYTSRDLGASPAMTVNHETVSRLPPVLQKLARRFSPLCSKFVHTGHCDTVLQLLAEHMSCSHFFLFSVKFAKNADFSLNIAPICLKIGYTRRIRKYAGDCQLKILMCSKYEVCIWIYWHQTHKPLPERSRHHWGT